MVTTARSATKPISEKASGHAGFLDYALVALGSLHANKLRSFLTLLGIIIGITSIIVVISLINGMKWYWDTKVANFGPNTFVITQFPIITNPDKFFEALRRNTEVHAEDADAIRRYCSSCEDIGVEVHKEEIVRAGGQTVEQVDVSGLTPNIFTIEPFDLDSGRTIMEWEEDHSQYVTLVGYDIVDKLFPSVDPIGRQSRSKATGSPSWAWRQNAARSSGSRAITSPRSRFRRFRKCSAPGAPSTYRSRPGLTRWSRQRTRPGWLCGRDGI